MPKYPVENPIKNWICKLLFKVNKNANCKRWDRTPGLEIINPTLYHPNRKSKKVYCIVLLSRTIQSDNAIIKTPHIKM